MIDPRLGEYLARIGLSAPPAPDPVGLAAVQRAHRLTIAFENLDIPLGRGIQIESDPVFAKLVRAQRGGYCFEQNRLLADMLALMGLPVRPLLARVWLLLPPGEVPPRTHTLLVADLAGEQWIADAGFGGGFCPPLPLRHGVTVQSPDGGTHRLRRWGEPGSVEGEWVLERRPAATRNIAARNIGVTDTGADWQPQYSFDLAEVAPADLAAANHWTSTRPGTRFTTLHVASLVTPSGLAALTDRTFTLTDGAAVTTRPAETAADWHAILTNTLGIALTLEDVARLPLFT